MYAASLKPCKRYRIVMISKNNSFRGRSINEFFAENVAPKPSIFVKQQLERHYKD